MTCFVLQHGNQRTHLAVSGTPLFRGDWLPEDFVVGKHFNRTVYLNNAAVSMSKITPEIISLLNFKQKLEDLGHFKTDYTDINDLMNKFGNQLNKVVS